MTLKTLRDNLLWIAFFLCVATYAQARNDYLNDYGTCERGSWETYTEVRQHEYKSGSPPLEFAELFNMCNKLGVVGVAQDKRPEGRHWDNLKIQYLKDNPEIIIMEQAIPNEIK